jgi:glycosyltransferase involved in cell wall biosynthesis
MNAERSHENDALAVCPEQINASHEGSRQLPARLVLFHDCLPHFDRSGADLRLFELVQELRKLGHHVTVVARDNRNENRYRPPLEELGAKVFAGDPTWRLHVAPENPCAWDLKTILQTKPIDFAILTHWFWGSISIPEYYMDDIRRYSPTTRILVLSEDRHGERERRCAQLTGLLSDIERGNDFEQREAEVYRRADVVLYVTETDRRRFLDLVPGLNTEHLPTVVEPAHRGPGYRRRSGVLFVGNFRNPANVDALDWMLTHVWPVIKSHVPHLRLHVAGFGVPDGLEKCNPGVICMGEFDAFGPLFDKYRVLAAPVRYGTGIITKNMHALAYGLPVVTTTVGAEGIGLKNGEHALIADTPMEFSSCVLRLCGDKKAWDAISVRGRDFVCSKFSIENLRSQIACIFSASLRTAPRVAEPDHQWSYRKVERAFPDLLVRNGAADQALLRTIGYWRLGRKHLEQGQAAPALQQFRHVFTAVRGRLTLSVFHLALLEDMARCYDQLGDTEMAAHCESEAKACSRTWPLCRPPAMAETVRDSVQCLLQ